MSKIAFRHKPSNVFHPCEHRDRILSQNYEEFGNCIFLDTEASQEEHFFSLPSFAKCLQPFQLQEDPRLRKLNLPKRLE